MMGLLRLAKGACGKNPVLIHSQLHTHSLSLFLSLPYSFVTAFLNIYIFPFQNILLKLHF